MSNDYEAAQTVLQPLSGHVGPGAAERLTVYAKLLRRWQQTHNLMGPEALDRLWNRHMTDSLTALPVIDSALQLTAGAAHAPAWLGLDLGSGAGFPGLALALSTADRQRSQASLPALSMTLVEATARKASFLRTVSRETAVHVTVENRRIEEVTRSWEGEPPHFVTARALAPLPRLIGYALPWLEQGAVAFFHKGVESDAEIAALPATVPVDVLSHPVSGEVGSVIIEVRHRHSKALAAES